MDVRTHLKRATIHRSKYCNMNEVGSIYILVGSSYYNCSQRADLLLFSLLSVSAIDVNSSRMTKASVKSALSRYKSVCFWGWRKSISPSCFHVYCWISLRQVYDCIFCVLLKASISIRRIPTLIYGKRNKISHYFLLWQYASISHSVLF